MSRELKLQVLLNGKIFGYERLARHGWEWMVLELNPDDGERWNHGTIPGEDFIRRQYTGKNDCKGIEIYENDQIYSCPGYSSVVLWEKEQACFISRYSHPEDPEDLLLSELGKDIEVINDQDMEDYQKTHTDIGDLL